MACGLCQLDRPLVDVQFLALQRLGQVEAEDLEEVQFTEWPPTVRA